MQFGSEKARASAYRWYSGSPKLRRNAFTLNTGQRQNRQRTKVKGLQELAGVLVFSAIPFALTQGFADSDAGKKVYQDLLDKMPELQQQTRQWEDARAEFRESSPWFGQQRPNFLGPISVTTGPFSCPDYLAGDIPGDYGYDPLRLGEDPAKLDRYAELELLHARWAMLGAFGALLPETLQLTGTTTFLEPVWYRVGYAKLTTLEDLNYLGVAGLRIAGSQGVLVIAICQVLLMFGPEYARSCGDKALEPLGLYLPGGKNYPGSWLFDPLKLGDDPARFERMRVREIKNGRLAMVAWLGFAAQGAVTGAGPVRNLLDAVGGST